MNCPQSDITTEAQPICRAGERPSLASQTAGTIHRARSRVIFAEVADTAKEVLAMRTLTVAFAFGTALVLCDLGLSCAAAQARKAKVVREPRERLVVTVPVVRPYW